MGGSGRRFGFSGGAELETSAALSAAAGSDTAGIATGTVAGGADDVSRGAGLFEGVDLGVRAVTVVCTDEEAAALRRWLFWRERVARGNGKTCSLVVTVLNGRVRCLVKPS